MLRKSKLRSRSFLKIIFYYLCKNKFFVSIFSIIVAFLLLNFWLL